MKPNWTPRVVAQWAVVIILSVTAIVYFSKPARAAELPPWSTELWATEEGEVMVAAVPAGPESDDVLVPTLAIMCGGDLWLRYDPGVPAASDVDWTGRSATFAFDFGDRTVERELAFVAMDAMFAVQLGNDDPLLAAIKAGRSLVVRLSGSDQSGNRFSLQGSTAAVNEVSASCG